LNAGGLENKLIVFGGWFSYLFFFPHINITVRCTFEIKSLKFLYQYPGAMHLKD